jgi:Ion channel
MLPTILLATSLVALCVLVHYEALKLISHAAASVVSFARGRMLLIIFGVIIAHLVEIGIYACGYLLGERVFSLGHFAGIHTAKLRDFVYFSAETYSSLGIGDTYPMGDLRLLASVEVLVGLILIGWSASFTYISMTRYWHNEGG